MADNVEETLGLSLIHIYPEYIKTIRSCPLGSLEEIVTDVPEVFEQLRLYFDSCGPEQQCSFRLYEDSMICLSNLYSLESVMDRACQKRVWLKSGGYLVIEYTEAMVVLDVNTGKYSGKKNQEMCIRDSRIILLTNCPTHIKKEYVINMPHPRDYVDPEFLRLRQLITDNMDLTL